MEIPVPQDWDGESWTCFEIQWPDSPEWLAILTGLITSVQRGPFWRARNKIEVEAAKLLGRTVVDRNLPFVDCRVCEEQRNGGGDTVALGASGGAGCCDSCCEESCEMGCITSLEIIDGVLYAYYGPCCRVEVGAISDISGVGEDPYNQNPDLPPVTEFSACGKADAIVTVVAGVVDAIWDARDDVLPWVMFQLPRQRFPDISFNDYWLLQGNLTALAVDAFYEVADVFDETTLQSIKCRLVNMFEDDAAGLQDGDFLKIQATFINEFGLLIGTLYRQALDAMGDGDLDRYIKVGATNLTAECDCPQGVGVLGSVTWHVTPTVAREDGVYTFLGRYDNALTARHQFVTKTGGSFNALGLLHAFDIETGFEVTEITLKFTPLAPAGELLHDTWHAPGALDCVDLSDAETDEIEAANRTELTEEVHGSSVYHRERWSVGQTALDWQNAEMRACPRDVESKTYQWQVSIISVNDTLTGLGSNPLD